MIQCVSVQHSADVVLAEKYGDAPPGTVIQYTEIESVSSHAYGAPKFWAILKKLRRHLLRSYQRATVTLPREGIRMVAADEHVAVGASFGRKAHRAARRGLEVMRQTRVDELSLDQRTAHVEALTHMASIVGVAKIEKERLMKLVVGVKPQLQLPSTSDVVRKL